MKECNHVFVKLKLKIKSEIFERVKRMKSSIRNNEAEEGKSNLGASEKMK